MRAMRAHSSHHTQCLLPASRNAGSQPPWLQVLTHWPRPGVRDAQKRHLVRRAASQLADVALDVVEERLATLQVRPLSACSTSQRLRYNIADRSGMLHANIDVEDLSCVMPHMQTLQSAAAREAATAPCAL